MKLLDYIIEIIKGLVNLIDSLNFFMLLITISPIIYWAYKKNYYSKLKLLIIELRDYFIELITRVKTVIIYVPQPILSPILKINKGHYAGTKLPITNSRLVIGRDAKYCQLVLPDNSSNVSRRHCMVHFNRQESVFMLEDCGSRNGTYVNGRDKLTEGEVFRLKAGDSFSLGLAGDVFEVGFEQSLPLPAIK